MNTPDNVYGGKEVRPLSEVPDHERAELTHPVPEPPPNIQTTVNTYDEMVAIDDPDSEVTQVLEAPANMLAAFFDESGYWIESVNYLVLIDDTALFGVVDAKREDITAETTTVDELDGFVGYLFVEGDEYLSDVQIEKLLNDTKNKED